MFMKRIGEKRRLRNLVAAVSVGLIAGAFSILPVTEANPVLDSKGAAVSIAGTTDMSITSTAANNVIKWIDFSIGAGEKVAFDSHNYLNYVTGHARSDILGTLTGGGSIYIVNPNGILIGDGAQVDVGSLYLSTRNLTTEQLAGFDTATAALFKTDSLSGDVINMGKLNADVISVEGHNITFKNVADVTKNVVVNEEITGTAANDSVTLTAHGGGIHLGYAVGTEATEVNASQYTDTQTPALNGWYLAGADPDYYMLVRNKYELQNMQNNLSGNYMLANTIDMSGVNFAPVGNGNYEPDEDEDKNYFKGNFNGLEHEIRNLCINADDAAQYVGLFGVNSGTIRNVGLVGGSITGTVNSYIGSIAGRNEKGTIENVFNTGTVKRINSDNGTVGGIVGSNYLGTIKNAYNTGAVTSTSWGGGIVAMNEGGTIENVFNTGAITGEGTSNWLGGIVGQNGFAVIFDESQPGGSSGGDPQMNHREVNGTITNAYNTGTVTSNSTSHSFVGGIAGQNNVYHALPAPGEPPHIPDESSGNSNIMNVYNTGTVSSTGEWVFQGGIVGSGDRAGNAYTSEDGDMKKAATFRGFDFSENGAWRIYEDKTTPLLTAFMKDKDEVISSNVYDGSQDVGAYTVATTKDGTGITQTGDNAINWHGLSIITPAAINVSFADTEKVYDGDVAATAGTATLTGKVGNDDVSLATGLTANFEDKNVGNGKSVNYTNIALTGTKAGNYTIADTATGTGTITAKNITVSFADISKTYDGTTSATAGAGTLNGVEDIDSGKVSVSASAAYADKNAGTNKQVDYTNVTLGGDEAGNYTIAAAATGTGVITPKAITATFADISKTYDGTITATAGEGTLTGVEAIDTGKVSVKASAAYADKNAGTDKQVDYSNVTLTGDEAGNYSIANTATGKGQIDRANLTVSVKDYSREYDGSISADGAELTVTSGTLYAGDSMSGGTKVFDTNNAGNGKTITVSEVTVKDSAGNANNYNISYAANTNSAITPKTLTVNFAAISKTYDGTTEAAAGTGILQGVVSGDDVGLQDGIAAVYDSKNAGNRTVNYSGIAIDGADVGNYTIAATGTGTGVINPKELTVSFADISKTYDGTTSATAGAGTLEGVEAVDTGKVSVTANAAYADKNAGTGKQVDYTNVALTGDEAGNYTIAGTATGKGQIDRANLTVSVKDYSREYDGSTSANGAELQVTSGTLYAGDTISGGTKVFDTKDVGTGKTITVSGVSINDGNNGDNYAVTYQPNTNSVITALPQPEPVNPQPSNPEPSKPEPVNPQPSNSEPSKPEPVNPQPSNPEPSNPEPVNTDPSQEQQLAETGNTVADIESATEKLGTEEVYEMKEKLVAPKHEALEVTDEKSGDDENEKKQSKK